MEVNFDTEIIQEVLNESSKSAISSAFSSYKVKETLEKAITDKVLPEILIQAMDNAVDLIDTDRLTQAIAEQLVKSLVSGTQEIIRETLVAILLRVKNIPSYESGKLEKERLRLYTTLFK